MAASEEMPTMKARPSARITTSLEKKAFTKFMLGSGKVADAAVVLQEVFVKDSDDSKNHSVDAAALVPLLSELKLNVNEDQASDCIDDADFDKSKQCEYGEFLIVIGLALQRHMSDDWTPPTEPKDLSSVKKCYDHIFAFWNRLKDAQRQRTGEVDDELSITTIKAMFSISGSIEDIDDVTAQRLKELDDNDDKSISLPEFFKTMFFWYGIEEE